MLRSYFNTASSGAQAHRIYCIYCIYCTVYTVYTHAPFRTCHEDSEKTVLDEWGTQNSKQNKNAEILKDVKMMMGKLIQESGESYSCSTVLLVSSCLFRTRLQVHNDNSLLTM